MAKHLRKGDCVSWGTEQGRTTGTVERKLTRRRRIKGHQVDASSDDPQYLVTSEKTGAKAAHKPSALRKLS